MLQREGLTASQAINRMYDKLIENGDASFLTGIVAAEDEAAWDNAVEFVDSLSEPVSDDASDAAEFRRLASGDIAFARMQSMTRMVVDLESAIGEADLAVIVTAHPGIDHAAIARWRREQSLRRTVDRRPDLLAALPDDALTDADRAVLGGD